MDPRPGSAKTDGILLPRTLGEALKLLQHRAEINRDDLAREAGVSTGAVSNYLNDASVPSAATLRRIAAVLARRLGEEPDRVWSELGQLLDEGRLLLTTQMAPGLAERFGEEPDRAWSALGDLLDHPMEALEAWSQSTEQTLSVADYRTHLYWLLRFALQGRATLEPASTRDIARFLASLSPEGEARKTAWKVLRSFYGWLTESGRRADDPTASVTGEG